MSLLHCHRFNVIVSHSCNRQSIVSTHPAPAWQGSSPSSSKSTPRSRPSIAMTGGSRFNKPWTGSIPRTACLKWNVSFKLSSFVLLLFCFKCLFRLAGVPWHRGQCANWRAQLCGDPILECRPAYPVPDQSWAQRDCSRRVLLQSSVCSICIVI